MSTFKDVADSAGAISVGAMAMLFGDPSGGTLAASGIAGLAGLGLALRKSSASHICYAAQKQVLRDLQSMPDLAGVNLARAHFLLTKAPSQLTLSPADLSNAVKAATKTSVQQKLARLIHACIPFERDDQQIETMLKHAILAGVRACYGDAAFRASMTSALLVSTVQDNDLQIILLGEIRQGVQDVPQQVVDLLIAQGFVPPSPTGQPSVDLADLITLAAKFEETGLNDAPELIAFLTNKAEEYQNLRAQIAALDDRVAAIANLKGAAQGAAERLDFDEVELLLSRVDEVETEIAAETKQTRAANALLRGRVQQAYTILSAAADSFASVDLSEPANRRCKYMKLLLHHGGRYGGNGLSLAIDMMHHAVQQVGKESYPLVWAMCQNSYAIALKEQGSRIGGKEGTALLARAVNACEAALGVRTKAKHPVDWAMTQNNLANTLSEQGIRTGGQEGTALLARAVNAYEAALGVRTKGEHSEGWALIQNNLAVALNVQGSRIGGKEGTALLARAVNACEAALGIRTKAKHPAGWAMTQNNLGGALKGQGSRTDGKEGTALLARAVNAYEAALGIRTKAERPVGWALTQNNLGTALQQQGIRTDGKAGAALLARAVAAYDAALSIRTKAKHPVGWAVTQNNLAVALKEQGIHTGGKAGTALLARAVNACEAALNVRTKTEHPVGWAMTQNNLALALQQQGARTDGKVGAGVLARAIRTFDATLSIRTKTDHPTQWAMTKKNLAGAELARADHPATPDPRPHLEAALAHVDAALTIYDPDHMPYDHGTATTLRNKIKARLEGDAPAKT